MTDNDNEDRNNHTRENFGKLIRANIVKIFIEKTQT